MNRRHFIRSACFVCMGGFTASAIISACKTNKVITGHKTQEGKITLSKNEFLTLKKGKTVKLKFLVIKPEGFQFPLAVYQISETEFTAIMLQCTHQGCELSAYETTMVCPCHGAEFNNHGKVTQGPAETDLKQFLVTNDHENIYITIQ